LKDDASAQRPLGWPVSRAVKEHDTAPCSPTVNSSSSTLRGTIGLAGFLAAGLLGIGLGIGVLRSGRL
jgi:hypothetical protein